MVVPVLVFAAGATYLLLAVERVEGSVHRVRTSEDAVHQSLQLASSAREQYNHVAHVLLLPKETEPEHLHHFDEAVDAFDAAAAKLERYARGDPVAQELLARARVDATAFQALFRDEILPAHHRGDRETALARHVDSERMLVRLVGACDGLSQHFRAASDQTAAEATRVSIRGRGVGIAVVLAACGLAALAAWGLWSAISVPLGALTEGIERFGRGQLDRAVEIEVQDELGAVATCLNEMAQKLRSREDALVKSERAATLGRLAAGIAHQLNNPLGVMLGYVKVLSDDRYGEDRRQDALAVLENEVRECLSTVKNLMELVRPSPPVLEPCQLASHIARVLERAARYAGADGVERETRVEEGLSTVTDCPKLEQALLNLVVNAVEATPRGGRVLVTAERAPDGVRIEVTDSGPGVPPADRDRIFDAYFTTKRAGTGLGLALASGLVRSLGGTLDLAEPAGAESGAPKGARFRITLPDLDDEEDVA